MLRAAVTVLAIVVLLTVAASEDDVSLQGPDGLRAHCSRKGASITVYRTVTNDTSTGKITLVFYELSELDETGQPVNDQSVSDGKHIISAFDKQNFTITGPVDSVLANSNEVNASCLTVTTSLQDISEAASFFGQVCAVKDSGMLFLGEENSTVSAGQLKFTVGVRDWVWAPDGKYLQLTFDIRIPPGRNIREDGGGGFGQLGRKLPKKFLFGGGAVANFSTQVKVDDTFSSMPTGFPMYQQRGTNNYITIRIPRFNTSAEYDPSIDPGSVPDTSSSSTTPSKGSFILPSSIPLGIIGFLMACVMQLL